MKHAHWRGRVKKFGQEQAVKDRSGGRVWSDDEVFKAILLAVLSSNTVWSKIERVQADLSNLFDNFSLEAYASHSEIEIESFVRWFEAHKAGSQSRRSGLVNLVDAARILLTHSKIHGSEDHYFTSLMHQCAGDPKQVAMEIGQGNYKLPSLGVALAAEALKNLGFDVAKADRHMMRAVGSFGLIQFNDWVPEASSKEHPKSQSNKKKLEVMTVAEEVAKAAGKSVVLVDNAIWILCAKCELKQSLTHSELAEIAHRARLSNRSEQRRDVRHSGSKSQRYSSEMIDPAPVAGRPSRRAAVEDPLPKSSASRDGQDPDYSVCSDWGKASEEIRTLFRELKTLMDQLGEVRMDPVATGVSFKRLASVGKRKQVIAHVYLRVRSGLRVVILEDLVRDIPLEDGFNRAWPGGPYREIVIRDREQIRKAKPLLRTAYDNLSRFAS